MKRSTVLTMAVAACLALAPGASAAPEASGRVEPGGTYSWTGATETGANPYYFRGVGGLTTVADQEVPPKTLGPFEEGRCSTAAYEQCDEILVELVNPLTAADVASGRTSKFRSATITLAESPERVNDFDLEVFQSDASGKVGPYWTGEADTSRSGNFNVETPGEELSVVVETTSSTPSRWMLVRVVRFATAQASYTGRVRF